MTRDVSDEALSVSALIYEAARRLDELAKHDPSVAAVINGVTDQDKLEQIAAALRAAVLAETAE